jgi:hypothetical protein
MCARVLTSLLLTAVFAATSSAQESSARETDRRIKVGFVLHPSASAARNGVTIGLEEAQRTGRLFGWEIELVRQPDSLDIAGAVAFLSAGGVTAIVGDLERAPLPAWERNGPLVLSIARRSTAPGNSARRFFFLLPGIDLPRAGEVQQTQSAADGTVMAWHPTLERFGAGEINQRFRARFGVGMDEHAWAGWMAMKILIEAALRTGSADARALESFLSSAAGRFDGHKGVPVYFDIATRELVQPVFSVRQGEEPVMLPARKP